MVIPLVQITGDSSQKESLVSNARREKETNLDRLNPLHAPQTKSFWEDFMFFFAKSVSRGDSK